MSTFCPQGPLAMKLAVLALDRLSVHTMQNSVVRLLSNCPFPHCGRLRLPSGTPSQNKRSALRSRKGMEHAPT